jgi:hypothetical protein
MPDLSQLVAQLPTPLAVGFASCLNAGTNPLGKRVADLFETWRRFTFALNLSVYLRGDEAHQGFNDLLFPAAESKHLPSALLSGLLHAMTTLDVLKATAPGAAIRDLLARVFGRTGGTDLVTALHQHAVYVHHRLSASAEDDLRLRQLTELLAATAEPFARGSIRGTSNGAHWEFRGCEPRAVEPDGARPGEAGVWLHWSDGTTWPLSDCFTIGPGTPPALGVADQFQLARQLSRWIASSPVLAAPYAHYQAELRGAFDFPPMAPTPAPAGFQVPLDEFSQSWRSGRPVLILRHLGGESASGWVRAALEASNAVPLWYPLDFSPVAAQPEAFRSWLWRSLNRAVGGAPTDNLPERTSQLEARIRELATQLRSRAHHVLVVDRLEKALGELPGELRRVQGWGLDVIALSEPVRLDFAAGWQPFYWGAEHFPEPERTAVEARIAELAPPGSLNRRLLEWVASADRFVTLRTLTVALKAPSPNVFAATLQLAPLFACPRGSRDLAEGYERVQLLSPTVSAVVRASGNNAPPLTAIESALTRAAAARDLFEARTAPPSHEPN